MSSKILPFLVGIAGGTGSGKTLLATVLARNYAGSGAIVLDQDSYYRDQSHLKESERLSVNYDEPSAVDHELLFNHLTRLLKGQRIQKPRYNFSTHTREPDGEPIEPAPVAFLEGLFALWDPRIRSLMHFKVFLDADADMRFIRRLRRDVLERERTFESVVEQYLKTVRPMHQVYVEPTRAHADLVVDNTGPFERVLEQVEPALAERYWEHRRRVTRGNESE